jgi:GMP synthase-like glutamine amidotransferase
VPLLGVCLGHQAIGQAFGGRVVRAPVIMHGKTSDVRHDGTGVFAGAARRGHLHPLPLARRAVDPPAELVTNAWVDEAGQRTIMGLRHAEHPTWGVQFHPESVLTEDGHAMLANFLAMARCCSSDDDVVPDDGRPRAHLAAHAAAAGPTAMVGSLTVRRGRGRTTASRPRRAAPGT